MTFDEAEARAEKLNKNLKRYCPANDIMCRQDCWCYTPATTMPRDALSEVWHVLAPRCTHKNIVR